MAVSFVNNKMAAVEKVSRLNGGGKIPVRRHVNIVISCFHLNGYTSEFHAPCTE